VIYCIENLGDGWYWGPQGGTYKGPFGSEAEATRDIFREGPRGLISSILIECSFSLPPGKCPSPACRDKTFTAEEQTCWSCGSTLGRGQ
jgi:hypothetical protein